jgi:nicotinamidase-related amidase
LEQTGGMHPARPVRAHPPRLAPEAAQDDLKVGAMRSVSLAGSIDPVRTAFVTMDVQPGILALAGITDEPGFLAAISRGIDEARGRGARIAFVRCAFTEQDYAAVPGHNRMFASIASARLVPEDDASAAIHPAIAPHHGDIVVTKTRSGAFSTTELARMLGREIDTLVLCGVSTSGVVLSTVREASDADYRTLVLRDGCADPRTTVHQVLLDAVIPLQADVIDIDELASIWL